VDPAAFSANNFGGRIDPVQFVFKRLDLRRLDEVDLVQEQDVCASICRRGVTISGKRTSMSASMTRDQTRPAGNSAALPGCEDERFGFGEPGRLDHNSLGRDLVDDLFTAASNSPSNEQQTHPPPSSEIRTFLPLMTFVSIATSPNSFITIAIFSRCRGEI